MKFTTILVVSMLVATAFGFNSGVKANKSWGNTIDQQNQPESDRN